METEDVELTSLFRLTEEPEFRMNTNQRSVSTCPLQVGRPGLSSPGLKPSVDHEELIEPSLQDCWSSKHLKPVG